MTRPDQQVDQTIDKARGCCCQLGGPLLGTAFGGVLAGLMVQFLPAPTRLVYEVLGAVFLLQGLGVVFIAETAQRRAGAIASLKPQFSVPAAARRPLLLATPGDRGRMGVGGLPCVARPDAVAHHVGLAFDPAGQRRFVRAGRQWGAGRHGAPAA